MTISYKKLWKLLIDKDLKKKDLCSMAKISPSSLAKLTKNRNVTTDLLSRICNVLQCNINDILESIPNRSDNFNRQDEGEQK